MELVDQLDALAKRLTDQGPSRIQEGAVVPSQANRPEPGLDRPLSEIKAELFKALAHPARVRALEVLVTGEHSVGDLQPLVGIESSHLSQQLGVLRRAGLVVTRKEGSSVLYSLRDPLVAELLAIAKRLLLASLEETRDLLEGLEASEPSR